MPIQTDGFTKDPGGSGGGSSDFGDITGWPGASTDFVRGDGSDSPLSAAEIAAALEAGSGTSGQVVRGDGTISALTAGDMPTGTVAYVKNTSDQTVTGSADNVLTLNSAILDPSSMLGGNRITVPVAGKYLVQTILTFNSNSTYYTCSLCHRKNGSTKSPAHSVYAGNGGNYTLSVASIWDLAANDYLESIWRPGNLINYPLGGLCTMSVERVGS